MVMNDVVFYLKGMITRLLRDKIYTLFCVLGTAFTFVFIVIILQLVYMLTGDVPPFVNADRTIVFRDFEDKNGSNVGGIVPEEMFAFCEQVKGMEDYYIYYPVMDQVSADGRYENMVFAFVNGGFWNVNQFRFVEGRPFTEEECKRKSKVIVLTEEVAWKFFRDKNVVGKHVDVQGCTYSVIGVVENYSTLIQQGSGMWLPYSFNKFVPDQTGYYQIGVLVSEAMTVVEMKKQLQYLIKDYMERRGAEINLRSEMLYTKQELQVEEFGDELLQYGLPLSLLLLICIPAINIVALNMANAQNYVAEVALHKALGASRWTVFRLKMLENLLVVLVGTILGFILVFPAVYVISEIIGVFLINQISIWVVIWTLPFILLFAGLSGIFPIYYVVRQNIVMALKGNMEEICLKWRYFWGIGIEQVLIFIVLMVCMVSVVTAIKQYREPGLLNVDNRVGFGYMLLDYGEKLDKKERNVLRRKMEVVLENLQAMPYVDGITESMGMIPYLRGEEFEWRDSVIIDNRVVQVMLKFGDKNALEVFEPKLIEGGWWDDNYLEDNTFPVVVTRQLLDELNYNFGVGRKIQFRGYTYTIVGVIDGLKQQVFGRLFPILILPLTSLRDDMMYREFCAKIQPGYENDFRALVNKECQRLGISKDATILCFEMNDLENASMLRTLTNVVMQVVPAVFLVFFAFIGTFGVFSLTVKKRRREFALRMVLGSSRLGMVCFVIGESLRVTMLSTIPGFLLSFFIYEWNGGQVLAIGLTFLLMILFSVFSAWYPAYRVSRLHPADVLRED